jgi:hypothetical protein
MQFLKNPITWVLSGITVSVILSFYEEDISSFPYNFATWLMIFSINLFSIIIVLHIIFPKKISKLDSKKYDFIFKYSLIIVFITMLLSLVLKG